MTASLLFFALLLDLLLGDPHGWPHPVVWIGRLIKRLETWLRQELSRLQPAGIVLVLLTLGLSGLTAWFGLTALSAIGSWLGWLLALYFTWSCLALRSLHKESAQVIESLAAGELAEARQALSLIVGRETAQLDEQGIIKACLETVAENMSDGVIAPLFYLTLGGPLLGLLYKAVNTLDSMVGYRNDRYLEFGWAAAKLDDLCNWIPARLTGLLIALAAFLLKFNGHGALHIMQRDASRHASPNAGWPEAAAAGALGVQLGGDAVYFGQAVGKATIGDADQIISIDHYDQMIRLLYLGSLLAAVVCLLLLGVFA